MKKSKQTILIRIPRKIHQQMLVDLKRPHSFAYERVGFMYTTSVRKQNGTIIILANQYVPVDDDDYIDDDSVGAKIGSRAIRKGMQFILDNKVGCFHVHLHDHNGTPTPSGTDKKGLPGVAESFANVAGDQLTGVLILSEDSFYASVKIKGEKTFVTPHLIAAVGHPMILEYPGKRPSFASKVFARQSFLGKQSEFLFKNIVVGIIGFGGGGSHIGQQLSHIGVKNVIVFDSDHVEDTNLNRLIGAWFSDLKVKLSKVKIAQRMMKKILPSSKPVICERRWQDNPELLHTCDIVFGCVDSYAEREQLEAECRRYLIPLIDIGMDVVEIKDGSHAMSGQIISSFPGQSCMKCLGFLTDEKLGQEAARYGKVGGRPQVVWPNGVLASTAVGLFVEAITGWKHNSDRVAYLAYDGNADTISDHVRLRFARKECVHYPLSQTGPVKLTKL